MRPLTGIADPIVQTETNAKSSLLSSRHKFNEVHWQNRFSHQANLGAANVAKSGGGKWDLIDNLCTFTGVVGKK